MKKVALFLASFLLFLPAFVWATSAFVPYFGGNVGIGTASPATALQVTSGAIVASAGSGSAQCVNFLTSNVMLDSYSATTTVKIGGLVDGGNYTLILTGYTGAQTVTLNGYTDSGCTSAISTGVDFGGSTSAVTNTFTAVGNTQVVSLIYSSTQGVAYASVITNFYK